MLTWRVGEQPNEKIAEIIMPATAEKLTTVKAHRRMKATLEQVDATHYRVHVTPVSTEKHEQPTPILVGSGEHPKKGLTSSFTPKSSAAPAQPQRHTRLSGASGAGGSTRGMPTKRGRAQMAKPQVCPPGSARGRPQGSGLKQNRLTARETLPGVAAFYPQLKQRLEFAYDAFGRRLEKKVYAWDAIAAAYQAPSDLRFVYDGWNLVAELNVAGPNTTIVRPYVHGTDLSGEQQGAGGVGGLLFATFAGTSAAYAYDGNGNIAGLADTATGAVSAAYEYDAFGRVLTARGSLAAMNPFRFSSQYFDTESALISYSQRYYSPGISRRFGRRRMLKSESASAPLALDNDSDRERSCVTTDATRRLPSHAAPVRPHLPKFGPFCSRICDFGYHFNAKLIVFWPSALPH